MVSSLNLEMVANISAQSPTNVIILGDGQKKAEHSVKTIRFVCYAWKRGFLFLPKLLIILSLWLCARIFGISLIGKHFVKSAMR